MDIVYLHGLKVETVIGIWDWERQFKQTLVFDIDMGTDISRAGASDNIEDTIDYKAVTKRVMAFAETHSLLLVEAMADRLAGLIMEEFGVEWIRIRINKKSAVTNVRDVGVVIERSRPAGEGT